MSKLNCVQKVAQIIGVKAGGSTFFSPDVTDPDNQTVYTSIEPMLSAKTLALVERKDLPKIAKARLQSLITKRNL